MVSGLKDQGIKGVVVPRVNEQEALVVDGIDIISVENITELLFILSSEEVFNNYERPHFKQIENENDYSVDFSDISGQAFLKRACEVAVAGFHNIIISGSAGTGKTMIAAAIANEIGAKFCSIGPRDILSTGVGNSEKAVAKLFDEARKFDCAIIFFDEIESLCPVSTHAQHARQVRSELLRQIQGLSSYYKESNKILFLIAATNKPWDIDPAFVRPGRFGIRVYVGLPDEEARRFMIENKLNKIKNNGLVSINDDIDIDNIILKTNGYNGSDMSYLLDEVQEISIDRLTKDNNKYICNDDFIKALEKITSSVQPDDIEKIENWREVNG